MRRESFVEEDSDGGWKWVSPSSAEFGKLTMPQATRWAGIRRVEFESAVLERHLPLVRIDDGYWQQEVAALERLGS